MDSKALFIFLFATIMFTYSSSNEFSGPGLDGPSLGPILDCLAAISENVRSCSNEIVAYFTGGTVDISPPCCDAITLIIAQCGPAVLLVFGPGPEHADFLSGYCGAIDSFYAARGPVPGPIGQPLPAVN